MRKSLIGILLFGSLTLHAQVSPYDASTLSQLDLMGTTRYVAMGGAMAAVGGDPSAAGDNPASLGIYRRSELSLTLDHQIGVNAWGQSYQQFSCGQASWNFCFLQDRMSGVVANNVMLNYRRLKNFRRNYLYSLRNMDYSQTDVMADKTDGLPESALIGEPAWRDDEVGWLSKMGYEGFLIDPDTLNPGAWLPANLSSVNGTLSVAESGGIDEFALTWGMNISNRWYMGLEMGVRSLVYAHSTTYSEQFADGQQYSITSHVTASGVGFVSKAGLMYRPTAWLRLGAAVHAPIPMAMTMRNYGTLDAMVVQGKIQAASPENVYSAQHFSQPMKVVAATAFQFGSHGMLSLQYDYRHDVNTTAPDVHWAKAGAEVVVAGNWYFNAGYGLQFHTLNGKKWADPIHAIGYNSVRTDTERINLLYAHYLSAGASFRHRFVVVGLAYQCRLMTETLRFHELQMTPIDMKSTTHKIVLTVAWRR